MSSVSSQTPDLDFVVNAFETLLKAAWQFTRAVATVAARGVNCLYRWARAKWGTV